MYIPDLAIGGILESMAAYQIVDDRLSEKR